RHTRWPRDWSSDVCSSDLGQIGFHMIGENGCPMKAQQQLIGMAQREARHNFERFHVEVRLIKAVEEHQAISTCVIEAQGAGALRSEEHTSELQSRGHLVCR